MIDILAALPARYQRPDVECYFRRDDALPDGGCIDVGIEDRLDDSPDVVQTVLTVLDKCVCEAIDTMADAKTIALRFKVLFEKWFPDRYWFAEVWTTQGKVKRYQVIQPAVVGGFRR